MAINALNQRIADESRHRENRARLAHAYARFKTKGVGTFEFEERVDFGLIFVERPFIATGHQIDDFEDQPDEAVIPHYPQCTAYVTDWDKTERDHYIGAWISVAVCECTPADEGGGGTGPTLASLQSKMAANGYDSLDETLQALDMGSGSTPPPAPTSTAGNYRIWHDITFSGIALKDIPSETEDELLDGDE